MTRRELLLAPLRAGILPGSPARSLGDAAASAAGSSRNPNAEGCPRGTATEEGTLPDRPDRTLEELADGIRDGSLAGLPLAKRLTMALADVLLVVRRDMEALADDARANGELVAGLHYRAAAAHTYYARCGVGGVERFLLDAEASFGRAEHVEAPSVSAEVVQHPAAAAVRDGRIGVGALLTDPDGWKGAA